MGGACGYGNLYSTGYGASTTALSAPLFNGGSACGACYQLQCARSNHCYAGRSITVTATNFCPTGSEGGWCNPPRKHFDLSMPMFTTLARQVAGVVPVDYRRVACNKKGGQRFLMTGNPYFIMVLVYNVAGAGDVQRFFVKGSMTGWYELRRNWGQIWTCTADSRLKGQALSFRTQTSDGRQVVSIDAAPANWNFGQTFSSGVN